MRASWRATIPAERARLSDVGRDDSFNTCLIEVHTDGDVVGIGEAKVGVGNLGNHAGVVWSRSRSTSATAPWWRPIVRVSGSLFDPRSYAR